MRLPRRRLLHALLAGLSGVTAAARWPGAGRAAAAGEAGESGASDALALGATEVETLVAFAEVLVGDRALSPTERGYLAEHIAEMARRHPLLQARYRSAAALLDRLAGGPLAALSLDDRAALVGRHRLDFRSRATDAEAERLGPEVVAVRTHVVPDLIHGYWNSPAGWLAVGYPTFPGRCGDLERYTRPEA